VAPDQNLADERVRGESVRGESEGQRNRYCCEFRSAAAPEMREKWERGDRKAFYPYGNSVRQVLVRMSNAVDQFE
jgi:hypothetical protein